MNRLKMANKLNIYPSSNPRYPVTHGRETKHFVIIRNAPNCFHIHIQNNELCYTYLYVRVLYYKRFSIISTMSKVQLSCEEENTFIAYFILLYVLAKYSQIHWNIGAAEEFSRTNRLKCKFFRKLNQKRLMSFRVAIFCVCAVCLSCILPPVIVYVYVYFVNYF